jgi:hypothetical protein
MRARVSAHVEETEYVGVTRTLARTETYGSGSVLEIPESLHVHIADVDVWGAPATVIGLLREALAKCEEEVAEDACARQGGVA